MLSLILQKCEGDWCKSLNWGKVKMSFMDVEDVYLEYFVLGLLLLTLFVLFVGYVPLVNYDADLEVDFSDDSVDGEKAELRITTIKQASKLVTIVQAVRIELNGCGVIETPQEDVSLVDCERNVFRPLAELV